jgi:hypothetical protein
MQSGIATPQQVTAGWRRAPELLRQLDAQPALAERLVWAAWGITRLLLLLGVVLGHSYCDPEFYRYAGLLATGHWPYRDVAVEYPPLAMALLLLPAVVLVPFGALAPRPDAAFAQPATHLPMPHDLVRYGAYGVAFAVEMLLIDLLTLWLLKRGTRSLLPGDPLGLRSRLLYIALIFASGALLQKFDLAAGTLCLLAVLALSRQRTTLAWGAIALATLIKGYPLLALPLLAGYHLWLVPGGTWQARLRASLAELRRGALAFASVVLAATLVVVVGAGWQAVLHTVLYHTDRGTEIESLYANALLVLGWLPGLAVRTAFHPGDLSRVVISPLSTWVAPALVVTVLALLGVVYLAFGRSLAQCTRARGGIAAARATAAAVAAVSLAFMLAFPALPVHYLLAVLPLAAVVRLPNARLTRIWLLSLLGTLIIGQVVVIAAVWHALATMLAPWAVLLLTLRNMAWFVAFAALVVALWHWTAEHSRRQSWETGHEGRSEPGSPSW